MLFSVNPSSGSNTIFGLNLALGMVHCVYKRVFHPLILSVCWLLWRNRADGDARLYPKMALEIIYEIETL